MIDLTRAEAAAVAQIIEFNLFESIRNDPDVDNIQWLISVVHAYEKLTAAAAESEKKRRGRKPKLTQAQQIKAIGLRRAGKTPEEIALAIGAPVEDVAPGGDVNDEND